TGIPVRNGIGQGDKASARRELGLNSDGPVLLVMGGSQGARTLNDAVATALDRWLRAGIQVLHICGKAHFEANVSRPKGYVVLPYTERMDLVYSAANLVLCRAGAGTLSELAACGLPSVLVPYPFAADDHQAANARVFAEQGAAVVLSDQSVREGAAEDVVLKMLSKPEQLHEMGEQARRLARPKAAEAICGLVEALGTSRR
ncbi:MAG: UDP-N-acetylglucosamine--N-acetylmuramyl-(pentapeptide) pyrophosphoryl-undecaprenol N-acetylglucosamine transferase, partial [Armatimonadota bacterium]